MSPTMLPTNPSADALASTSNHSPPQSYLFSIKTSPTSGRSLFATQDIPAHTLLLATDCVPIALVLREYRREVCGWCFMYEQGDNLRIRDALRGFSFCGEECLEKWKSDVGDSGCEAWEKVEDFVRRKSGMRRIGSDSTLLPALTSSTETINSDADEDVILTDILQRPPLEEIEIAWTRVESTAHFIRQARNGSVAKPHRRAVGAVMEVLPHPDTLYLLLAGVLAHWRGEGSQPNGIDLLPSSEDGSKIIYRKAVWSSVLSLAPDATPYNSTQHLNDHVHAYLHLLAILPPSFLPSVTPALCRTIISRDSHNSFGIRSLEDEGSEFFGYGVWPAASYFNHGCAPNVSKRRVGRTWEFLARRDVVRGEELEISYLGGEEDGLDMMERRSKLMDTWGFICACRKCAAD